jgi:hypothetical protein
VLSETFNSTSTLKTLMDNYAYSTLQVKRGRQKIFDVKYFIKIFNGISRFYINKCNIVNIDEFLTIDVLDVNDFSPYMHMRSCIIDYLIDNPHIDVNIESKYNDRLDAKNNILMGQYRGALNEHKALDSVVGIITQFATTRNQRLPELLQIYAEAYGGWNNIVSANYGGTADHHEDINPYVLREKHMKYIATLNMLKHYCKYLKNTYPNPDDDEHDL